MRVHKNDISISDPITLDDLRWLVSQCENFQPSSKVTVKGRREYSQIDYDPAEITVHGKDVDMGVLGTGEPKGL